jgi:DNA polymerase III delta subunit
VITALTGNNSFSLVGNNSFALHRRLEELVNSFKNEHGDLALERIDAEEADVQAILDTLQNLPFLVARKMVVVRGFAQNKQASEKIEQIIDAAGEDTDLILYETAVDKRTAYFKTLKPNWRNLTSWMPTVWRNGLLRKQKNAAGNFHSKMPTILWIGQARIRR